MSALAQSDRGTLTGTVSDPAGATVPSASVTVSNMATGALYTSVTTATGNYTVPALPAGRYSLTIGAQGFSQYVQEGITIQVAQTARVDVVLKIGATSESVTIMADAPLLRTENAEQSQTVSGDTINQLPLTLGGNNLYGTRNPLAGLDLAPGVANIVGTNFVFRANGVTNAARYLLDGQDITTLGMNSAHLSESHPSTEALQEVTLQTSNFAAEFGQVRGGLVNFTTRSGSNEIHGGFYDYFMNEALNAGRGYTDNGKGKHIRPRMRNNNYGFTVGGPVYLPKLYDGRNKTFFFFNFDQFRNKATVSGSAATIPTEAYRNGNFSAALTGRQLGTDPLGRAIVENSIYDPATQRVVDGKSIRDPFSGNTIPIGRFDPVAVKVQALFPKPANDQLVNNLPIVDNTASTTTLPSIKIDQLASLKTKISFYYGEWNNTVPKSTGDGIPFPLSNAREFVTYTKTLRLSIDHSLTPTTLLHLGLGEIRYDHLDSGPSATRDFDAVGKLGLKGGLRAGMPYITGLGAGIGGFTPSIGWTLGNYSYDDKPTISGSGTVVRGNHTYKMGVEWWKDIFTWRQFNTVGRYNFSGANTGLPYLNATTLSGGAVGLGYASFLLGDVNTSSMWNGLDPQMRKWATAFYVQDTWKITRRLTLDYGLRYDYQTGWKELHGRTSSFDPFTANKAVGGVLGATAYERDRSFTEPYAYGFGPRLGVAYQINNRTVLRAGWGFVYGQTPTLNYARTASVGVGFNTLDFTNTTFGAPVSQLKDGLTYDMAKLFEASWDPYIRPQPGTLNAPPSWVDDTGGRPPRINQWNVALQREIVRDLSVEAAYIGHRTAWTEAGGLVDLNALSLEMLAQKGFNPANSTDRSVLISAWNSAGAQARGISAPYAGYPTGATVAQSLRRFPQFSSVGDRWSMRGFSWYDALQTKLTKRYSHNLQATMSFTWQKELDYGASINNVFNPSTSKALSSSSQPFILAIGFTYQTPAVGQNSIVRAVVRDWSLGGFVRNASGFPIAAPASQNNLSSVLFQTTRMNRVPGAPLFLKDLNCHCIDPNKEFVLNPAAWTDAAPGTFGTAAYYYNDYRFQRHPSEQLGIGRIFRIREGMSLEVRFEFFNVLNRIQMADPVSANPLTPQTKNAQGVPISGFGYINSQSPGNASVIDNRTDLGGEPRKGQLLVRFKF